MADIYKASEAATSASQREALAALARGGTQERAAFEAAQRAQAEDKTKLYRDIMERATAINAPAGAVGEMQAAAGPGMDRRATALLGAKQSAESALTPITEANRVYFDQVAGAIPLVKARSDEINEARAFEAVQEEQERQMRLAIQQMALQKAGLDYETAAQRAASASGDDMTPGKVISRLGGQTVAGNVLRQAATEQAADFSERRGANGPGSAPRSVGAIADEIGGRVGLPGGYGSTLVGITAPKEQRPSQMLTDANAQAELAAREARLRLLDTAKRAASKGTHFELLKAVDIGEEDGLEAALDYVASLKDDYLKRNSISRKALVDWVQRYGRI